MAVYLRAWRARPVDRMAPASSATLRIEYSAVREAKRELSLPDFRYSEESPRAPCKGSAHSIVSLVERQLPKETKCSTS